MTQRMDKSKDWMNGRMDGWMDGWMGGWITATMNLGESRECVALGARGSPRSARPLLGGSWATNSVYLKPNIRGPITPLRPTYNYP